MSTPHKNFVLKNMAQTTTKILKSIWSMLYILTLKAPFNSTVGQTQPISRLEEAYKSEETNSHAASTVFRSSY